MKKNALVPLMLAFAATGACRSSDLGVRSAGAAEHPGQSVGLTKGGLTTGSVGLHHSTLIEFGEPRAQVISKLQAALGGPSAQGRNEDCPNGPVDFLSYGPMDLHFTNGRFVGWVIDEAGAPEFESYRGLSFGDRRSDLDGDAEIEVMSDSTLGTELTVDGIGVLMSGPGQSDRVENLFAGVTCFAR